MRTARDKLSLQYAHTQRPVSDGDFHTPRSTVTRYRDEGQAEQRVMILSKMELERGSWLLIVRMTLRTPETEFQRLSGS